MKLMRVGCVVAAMALSIVVGAGVAVADEGGARAVAVGESGEISSLGSDAQATGGEPAPEMQPALVDMSGARVTLPQASYVYRGAAVEPDPTVQLDGVTLVRGRDFEVLFEGNYRIGRATLTVKGLASGGYAGAAVAAFEIVPAKANLARLASTSGGRLTARVAGVAGAQGYQFRIGNGPKLKKGVRMRTVTGRSCTFKGLVQGAKYYVKARAYATVGGTRVMGEWSRVKSVRVKWKPAWLEREGYYLHRKADGTFSHGLATIGGRTYLFDGAGRQKTGWQRANGAYRFFNSANGKGGFMAKGTVVNGIALGKDGAAKVTGAGAQELSIMCKAQSLVESLTVPAQSKRDKLLRGFKYLKDECVESLTRNFSAYTGWHRAMARDVFDRKTGSCFSYGAALAYFANAIGYRSCAAVSSGGHGWAEIDGLVYDAEWSRHCGRDLFGIAYSQSGGGVPAYASSRVYVVPIAPHASRW